MAQDAVLVAPPASPPAAQPLATSRINTTGRDIKLTGPLREGESNLLGEVDFILHADDSIEVNTIRLQEALRPVLADEAYAALQANLSNKGFASAEQLAAAGYPVTFDPVQIGLKITIPGTTRPTRTLSVYDNGRPKIGEFDAPAGLAGYINFRNFASYVWNGPDKGFVGPTSFIDSAIRYKGFVLENEAFLSADGTTPFRRDGTRLVYDDRDRLIRWSAGDLRPLSRGFSGAPEMAGIGITRIYSILDPLLLVQPRGDRTFTLARPSTVEALVNGQPVRRFRLEPGTYNLRDLPFTQGGNDVQLQITDDSGLKQDISFTLFFDRTLLAPGRTEFGLYAGVLAPRTNTDRDYQFNEPAASGFIRRGLTETLTAGANFNVQKRGGVGGAEVVWANPLGTFGADVAYSSNRAFGSGYAFNIGYQGTFRQTNTTLGLTAEYRSENFSNPSDFLPFNRYTWDLALTLGQRIFRTQYISVTGRYSMGRNGFQDEKSVRLLYGARLNDRMYLTAEASYQDGQFYQNEYGLRLRLTYRFSRRTSASAELDTISERLRLGAQTSRGSGVGALALSGDVDIGRESVGVNASANYIANRADIGLDHTTLFATAGDTIDSQRTSLRFGTSLVFADGRFALSRPIYDSFAMVAPHKTLKGADVYIDPQDGHYSAKSGFFGPAVEPSMSAYIPRVLSYDVPDAPAGYDIGRGTVRMVPPYRSGYLVIAGSDYSLTGMGTLLNPDGTPVVLLAGRAVDLGNPDRPGITVFTNRAGRFGISGLKAGRWRIDMPTQPPRSVIVDVPNDANGIVRLGEIKLGDSQ